MKLIKLKFHIWFKYGLKAQKFQKQHALKGQKLLAQGIALGITAANLSPCKVGCSKSINFSTRFLHRNTS